MKYFPLLFLIYSITPVVHAQNVGIGTVTPFARLHVTDSAVLFSANGLALTNPGNPPVQGTGRRMLWYADKAAFRAGYASGTEWDNINTGKYSFASGYGVKASGDFSFAAGLNNIAAGQNSIAIGYNAQATANFAVSIGTVVFATNEGALAMGFSNFAQGRYSLALGYNNIAKSLGGTVVGQYNDFSDTPDPNDTSSLDRIFQVGNGYYDVVIDDEVRRNALTILRNGNTGIGITAPANKLSVAGNADISGNLGIGITNPGFPVSFSNILGDKISFYGNSGNHYGLGIQPGLFQMYSDAAGANIVFGFGSSNNFTERARIINAGSDGMNLKGRLLLMNGTSPINTSLTPGIWLYRADNAAPLGFIGTQNNQNIGFFGGPVNAGWGFVYDAINGRIGIGNSNPQFLMDINGRIRIRHANAEEPGIWLNNNTNTGTPAFIGLQNNTNVGLYGADGAGWALTMNTANGALNINGSPGASKQVLMSNGTTSAPAWTTAGNIFQTIASGVTPLTQLTGSAIVDLPASTINLTITVPSRILVYSRANTWKTCLAGACQGKWYLYLYLDGAEKKYYGVDGIRFAAENSSPGSDVTLGPEIMDVDPGIHTISFKGANSFNDPYITLSAVIMVIPR